VDVVDARTVLGDVVVVLRHVGGAIASNPIRVMRAGGVAMIVPALNSERKDRP
jgi:hypothetical protein